MNVEKDANRTILRGKYQITGEIGRGGMGVVYKGIQCSLGRPVAIKFLPAQLAQDREFVQRFRREAEVLGRLNHENIVTIHDLDAEGDENYLVMELVDGHDLASLLGPGKLLPTYLAVRIASQVAAALDAAHRCGVIHRDVKPQNILIENATGRVKVADFGVAAMSDSTSLTRTGTMLGTPKYMSPEQIQGRTVTGATDIYALGVVLYEMLAGRAPFLGDTAMAVAYQHIDGALPPLAGFAPRTPPDLIKIVERALQKQPERRFSTAGEMAQALRGLHVPEEGTLPEGAGPPRRKAPLRLFAIGGVIGLLAVAAIFMGPSLLRSTHPASEPVVPPAPKPQAEAPASTPAGSVGEAQSPASGAGPTSGGVAGSVKESAPAGASPSTREAARGDRSLARSTSPPSPDGKARTETGVSSVRSAEDAPAMTPGTRESRPADEANLVVPPGASAPIPRPPDQTAGQPPSGGTAPTGLERAVYDNAQRAFDSGNYVAALAGYRSYLEKNPDPELLDDVGHGIAECLYNQGNLPAAIAGYRKVVEEYPASKWADDSSYAIAWCQEKQKAYPDAIGAYEAFLARFPASDLAPEAQYRVGRCYFDQGRQADAIPAYAKVIQSYPQSKYADLAQYSLGECSYRQGDYTAAAREYAKVVANYPASQWADDAQISIGWSYFKQKEFAAAAREYALVEQRYPQSDQIPAALLGIARCRLDLGDRAAGRDALQEVIRRFPSSKAAGEAQQILNSIR
jgi:serine/threonine protein kinase/outer membrane protein assembly factor BamD (BamD/ComL family)